MGLGAGEVDFDPGAATSRAGEDDDGTPTINATAGACENQKPVGSRGAAGRTLTQRLGSRRRALAGVRPSA